MDESDQGAGSDPVYSDIEPPVEDKPVRDGGVHTELVANTVTRSRMEGELTIEYEQSNSECILILDFEAFHMDSGVDDKEPMIDPQTFQARGWRRGRHCGNVDFRCLMKQKPPRRETAGGGFVYEAIQRFTTRNRGCPVGKYAMSCKL